MTTGTVRPLCACSGLNIKEPLPHCRFILCPLLTPTHLCILHHLSSLHQPSPPVTQETAPQNLEQHKAETTLEKSPSAVWSRLVKTQPLQLSCLSSHVTPPPVNCIVLIKLLNLPMSPFPHWQNGDKESLPCRIILRIKRGNVKPSELCLPYGSTQ